MTLSNNARIFSSDDGIVFVADGDDTFRLEVEGAYNVVDCGRCSRGHAERLIGGSMEDYGVTYRAYAGTMFLAEIEEAIAGLED